MLTEGEPILRRLHHIHGLLPSDPRCNICGSPRQLDLRGKSEPIGVHVLHVN